MQPPLPTSTPTGAPTFPTPTPPSGDPLPSLIGHLSQLLRQLETPPQLQPGELKNLMELLRALHRQNTALISRPRTTVPWPQLVILTSLPVLAVLLILTFLRPSWLVPQPNLIQVLEQQHRSSTLPPSHLRSTPKP